MSLLSRATASTGKLSTNIPEKSAQGRFYLKCVVLPANGSNQFPSMSVVPLERIVIPYNFKKSAGGKNSITEVEAFDDIILEAGSKSLFISIYSVPSELISEMIIELRGITFSAFRPLDNPENRSLETNQSQLPFSARHARPSFEAKQAAPCYHPVVPMELMKIPRENQTMDLDRDVISQYNGLSPESVSKKTYTFVVVRVTGNDVTSVPTDDGLCYGTFAPLNIDDPKTFAYAPFQKDNKPGAPKGEILALSGGSHTDGTPGVRDIELFICQNAFEDGTAFMVTARTKLFSGSISPFQVGNKWKQLGPVFAKDLRGTAICVVDPIKSKDQNFTQTPSMAGAIACSTTFFPDLVVMSRSLGISCTWDEMITIGGISDPSKLVSAIPFKSVDIINVNAVNILGYSGDITRLKKGYEDGEVEFWVVSNIHDMAKEAIAETPEKKTSMFANPKNFAGNTPAVVIYAFLKKQDGDVRIHDYLKSTPDMPAAIDSIRLSAKRAPVESVAAEPETKRQHVAEEEVEGEEEEEEKPKAKTSSKKSKKAKPVDS